MSPPPVTRHPTHSLLPYRAVGFELHPYRGLDDVRREAESLHQQVLLHEGDGGAQDEGGEEVEVDGVARAVKASAKGRGKDGVSVQ